MEINKLVRPCILKAKEYIPGKPVEEVQRELGLTDIIKLASNENPLGASPKAVDAMLEELKNNAHQYPEGTCPNLAAALAVKHHLSKDHFYIDNGVDGVITILALTFINPGDETVTSQFSFPAYASVTNRMDGNAVLIPQTPDRRFDVDAILKAVNRKTKMVFIANPNNPTGTIITKAEFDKLVNNIPESTLLVCDEAYYDFAGDAAYPQTIPYLENHPNLIILRTFSKIMGLAGVRIGYAIAHPEVIKMMMRVRDPFPVNRAAQAGALAALDDTDFIRRSIQLVDAGRQQFYRAFDEMGIKYTTSQANFVFFELDGEAQPLFEALLREGVIVRPLGPQGMPNCIRITIGTTHQNERAIRSLQKVLKK